LAIAASTGLSLPHEHRDAFGGVDAGDDGPGFGELDWSSYEID
jgi:hypothetical protein